MFNVVEGIIDHYILNLHHVVDKLGLSVYDHAFIGAGLLFLVIGWGIINTAGRDDLSGHPAPTQR